MGSAAAWQAPCGPWHPLWGGGGRACASGEMQGAWPGAPRRHPAFLCTQNSLLAHPPWAGIPFPRIYKEEVPLSCPCSVLPRRKRCPAGSSGGTWRDPSCPPGRGLTVGTGDKIQVPSQQNPLWGCGQKKSHTTALGRTRAFQMVLKIWSDFCLEPESSWLVAGEAGVLVGAGDDFKCVSPHHKDK